MHAPRTMRLVAATALAVLACTLAPAAALAGVTSVAASPSAFVPDWDGHTDDTVLSYRLVQQSRVTLRVVDARGRVAATLGTSVQDAGEHETTWDGRDDRGRVLAPGTYQLRVLTAAPATGTARRTARIARTSAAAAPTTGTALVTLKLPALTLTRVQLTRTSVGRTKRAASTSARFTLSRPATISAAVVDAQGRAVATLATGKRPAGTSRVTWNGRTRDGARAADGDYSLVVAATTGGRPTGTSRVPLRVDRVAPDLTVPEAVTATVAGSVVSVPLTIRVSEPGTAVVRFGRRSAQQGITAGANTVTVPGGTLGLVATPAQRTVTVTVLATDGAGNAVTRQVAVTVPPRKQVVDRAPTGDGDSSSPQPTPGATGSWPWPSIGIVTSEFGVRWGRKHEGLDIGADTGTPIHPAVAGTVAFVGSYGGYGNLVIIDHGNGLTTRYGHMSRFGSFAVGAAVTHDDVIGYIGCTGSCTGPHLHFEVRTGEVARSPRSYLVAR